MKNVMNFERIFHPVGQGAFYTERFTLDKNIFNIVYDCGSTTKDNQRMLEHNIRNYYSKGDKIDILFISHFHTDHINGIKILKEHTKIKCVVIPLLSNEAKLLSLIELKINSKKDFEDYYNIILNPEEFFGEETEILKVDSIINENNNDEPIVIESENDTKNLPEKINSGREISKKEIPFWKYIPFNFEENKRISKLKEELKKQQLQIKDILEKIKENDENIIDNLKIIYKNIGGTDELNNNSLVLTSVPIYTKIEDIHYFCSYRYIDYCYLNFCHHLPVGCVYFGDSNPNTNSTLLKQLKDKLNRKACNDRCMPIGTIQIPHHGSTHNYTSEIFTNFNFAHIAIISAGESNKYNHPSKNTLVDILRNRKIPFVVTELLSTTHIQHFKIIF